MLQLQALSNDTHEDYHPVRPFVQRYARRREPQGWDKEKPAQYDFQDFDRQEKNQGEDHAWISVV